MSQLFNGAGITIAYGSANKDNYYWGAEHLTVTVDEGVLPMDRAQMEVLENYRVSNLLPIRYTGGGRLLYPITAKTPLSEVLAKRRITRSELTDLVYGILAALKEIDEEKTLTGAGLILDERFVFVHPNKFTPMLMYLPVYREADDLRRFMGFIYELAAPSKLEDTGGFAEGIRGLIQSGIHSLRAFEDGFGVLLSRTPPSTRQIVKNFYTGLSVNDLPLPEEITASAPRKDILNEIRLWGVFILSNILLALLFCWLFLPDTFFLQHLPPAKEVPYLSNALFSGDGFSLRGFIVVSALFLTIELILCLILFSGGKPKAQKVKARREAALPASVPRCHEQPPANMPESFLGRESAPQSPEPPQSPIRNPQPSQPGPIPEHSLPGALPSDWGVQPFKAEPGISVVKSHQPAYNESIQPQDTADDTVVKHIADDTVVITEQTCPYLEHIVNGVPLQIFIRGERFLIGRVLDECHYISPDPMVGKRHAEILSEGGDYYIKEIKAQNHTYLSGASYGETETKLEQDKKYLLSPGVKIRMALDSIFIFRI